MTRLITPWHNKLWLAMWHTDSNRQSLTSLVGTGCYFSEISVVVALHL